MTASTLSDKKINRRIASRIYEQSNLFYRKIDRSQIGVTQPSYDILLDGDAMLADSSLPASQSMENDTLNVNISASGIAFTSKEHLNAGDYLLLRILILSNMTVIMTCCRVIYCKPSNPYETDRYPYLIGAEFVNMTSEDRQLLNNHVSRKTKQKIALNGSLLTLLAIILLNPLDTLHLAITLSHHLVEILGHTLYLVFEYMELGLDHVIEHAFHTELHTTQIIVFYTLVTAILISLYYLGRLIIIPACIQFAHHQRLFWSRKQASMLYYWSEQTAVDKFKIIGISTAAIIAYVYFAS
jgi:hypothetical protein